MSIVTEIRFAHGDGALAHTLNELPDVDIKVIRDTSTEPGQSTYFIRLDHSQPETIRSVLAADHTVRTVSPLSESGSRQVWRVEFTDEARLLNPLVTSEGGFVLHARSSRITDDQWGWQERWLLPDHESLHSIWQDAREAEFEFEILQFHPWDGTLSEYTGAQTLTEEQRDTLALAYERGYFTEPRETDLEALADELGRSPSAVAGRLKRGMKLLIAETLLVDQPET
jgi:hypothetical protein